MMKLKKFFCVFLVAMMCFSLNAFVYASESIELNASIEGLKLFDGEVYFKTDEQLVNQNKLRATSRPTSYTYNGYSANWSGTNNCTYTQYYAKAATYVKATTRFEVDFYNTSGKYIATVSSAYDSRSGYYKVSLFQGGEHMYGLIWNLADGSSQNAYYYLYNEPYGSTPPGWD